MEFIYEGYRCVALENEKLRVTFVADKGTDIYEFLYKPRDVDFMWRTRVGLATALALRPVQPSRIRRAHGLLRRRVAGAVSELRHALRSIRARRSGQHGEVLLLPWRYAITKDDPDEIEVRFDVRTVRTPFHLVKTVTLRRNEAALRIHERVTNEGGQEVDFTWGHHPAFGWPFIDEHCRVDLPDCRIRTFAEFTPDELSSEADQTSHWPLAEGLDGERDRPVAHSRPRDSRAGHGFSRRNHRRLVHGDEYGSASRFWDALPGGCVQGAVVLAGLSEAAATIPGGARPTTSRSNPARPCRCSRTQPSAEKRSGSAPGESREIELFAEAFERAGPVARTGVTRPGAVSQ